MSQPDPQPEHGVSEACVIDPAVQAALTLAEAEMLRLHAEVRIATAPQPARVLLDRDLSPLGM